MGTGKITDDYTYYEGFEDEPEVVFNALKADMKVLHIWDGYIDDILRDPNLAGQGWTGFTRDYHQCEGAFGDDDEGIIYDIPEYLNDLKSYATRSFDYDETEKVYNLLCSWLEEAVANQCDKILVKVI